MTNKEYKAVIEAILFTMGESVELEKIADTIELDKNKTKKLIEEMMKEWKEQARVVTIIELESLPMYYWKLYQLLHTSSRLQKWK